MNFDLFADTLDQAIVNVAEAEYSRLNSRISPDIRAGAVAGALHSLADLSHGTPPKYNEWEALFYLTWYQPRQINLALAIIRHFLATPQPLHIIDVGCGALATQMAMAVAVAESTAQYQQIAPLDHQNVEYSEVHGIDPSSPMRNIGRLLWNQLRSIIKKEPKLALLHRAFETVEENSHVYGSLKDYYRSDFYHRGGIYPSMNCLLTAFHAVYKSNANQLQKDFTQIRQNSGPAYEAVTCHSLNLDMAKLICRSDASEDIFSPDRFIFRGYLPKTTSWRYKLMQSLPQSHQINAKFLQRGVSWDPLQGNKFILWSSS